MVDQTETEPEHRPTSIVRALRRKQRTAPANCVDVTGTTSAVVWAIRCGRASMSALAVEAESIVIAEISREISPPRKRARRPPARHRDV